MESEWEIPFLRDHSGLLMDTYRHYLPSGQKPLTVSDHVTAVLEEVTTSGNLLLVHNTFINKEQIDALKKRPGIFYCLCPESNMYIAGKMPPVRLLYEEGCKIVIGTDSLASNSRLDILSELKIIEAHFPEINLETLVRWATFNGALALGESSWAGSIEPGKRPGLVLLKNADLVNRRLTSHTTALRLI